MDNWRILCGIFLFGILISCISTQRVDLDLLGSGQLVVDESDNFHDNFDKKRLSELVEKHGTVGIYSFWTGLRAAKAKRCFAKIEYTKNVTHALLIHEYRTLLTMQDVRTKSGVKIEVERIGVYRYLHYINEMSITYDDPEKGSTTVEGYSGLFYALPDPNLYTESITAQLAKGIDEAEIGENFLGLVIGMLYCFGEMIDKNYITNLLTPSAMALKLEKRTTTKKGKTTTTFTYRVYHTDVSLSIDLLEDQYWPYHMATDKQTAIKNGQFSVHHYLDGLSTLHLPSLKDAERSVFTEKIAFVISVILLAYEPPHYTKHVKVLIEDEPDLFSQKTATFEIYRVQTTHFRKVSQNNFDDLLENCEKYAPKNWEAANLPFIMSALMNLFRFGDNHMQSIETTLSFLRLKSKRPVRYHNRKAPIVE